jgi:PilZ domain
MPAVEKPFCGVEMRTAPRHLILQRCFVHPANAAAPEAWRSIAHNISAAGIGITLPKQLPEGTLLTIQAYGLPRSCRLQARVVRARQVDFFWFTSCELVGPLSDADLRIWCSGPTDWLDERK